MYQMKKTRPEKVKLLSLSLFFSVSLCLWYLPCPTISPYIRIHLRWLVTAYPYSAWPSYVYSEPHNLALRQSCVIQICVGMKPHSLGYCTASSALTPLHIILCSLSGLFRLIVTNRDTSQCGILATFGHFKHHRQFFSASVWVGDT